MRASTIDKLISLIQAMNKEQIEKVCADKEQELLRKYFGNLVKEAAILGE